METFKKFKKITAIGVGSLFLVGAMAGCVSNKKYNEDVEDLKETISVTEKIVQEKSEQLGRLTAQLDSLNKQLQARPTKSDIESVQTEVTKLEQDKSVLKENNSNLEQEKINLEQEISDVKAELNKYTHTPSEIEQLKEDLKVAQEEENDTVVESEDFSGYEFEDVVFDEDFAETIDSDNFEELLADSEVEDDDGSSYEYSQELEIGNQIVGFDNPDGDVYDVATPVIDFGYNGDYEFLMKFVVEMDGSDELDLTGFNDGETIKMFGKTFTFDQNTDTTGDISLYASENTVLVPQGETVTVTADGNDYDISVIGGNSDGGTNGGGNAMLQVGSDTETVESGNVKTIGGLELYVDDVFISNIGTSHVSVNLFIGSEKWTLPEGDSGATTLEINDEDVDGVDVNVSATADNEDVTKFEFLIDPTEFENDETGEKYEWLMMGEEFTEPLFDFKLDFGGVTPDIQGDSDTELEVKKSSDDLVVDFVTEGNDQCSVTLFTDDEDDSNNIVYHEDFRVVTGDANGDDDGTNVATAEKIAEDDIFILNEDDDNSDATTKIYEVQSIDYNDDEIVMEEICSGKDVTVSKDDQVEDTEVYVNAIDSTDDAWFTIDTASATEIFTKNIMKLEWNDGDVTASSNTLDLTIGEDVFDNNYDDVKGNKTITLELDASDSDDEIDVKGLSDYTGNEWTSENDVEYGMTKYGTYWELDTDDYNEITISYPSTTRHYDISLTTTNN